MKQAVISGTGLYTPSQSISNEELVESFNAYVAQFNADNAAAIDAGTVTALEPSSVAFIEKASGIKSRFVMEKAGILDPQRMVSHIPERGDDELSLQAEICVAAAHQALDRAGRTPADIDMVLVACSNMQRGYPAMAVEVQAALGIDGYGFDMNVACSSATFGIQQAVTAVQASPKMKWLSRSRQFRWPLVISGLRTNTARAWPLCTAATACWMPKVADEQATFMSKP